MWVSEDENGTKCFMHKTNERHKRQVPETDWFIFLHQFYCRWYVSSVTSY